MSSVIATKVALHNCQTPKDIAKKWPPIPWLQYCSTALGNATASGRPLQCIQGPIKCYYYPIHMNAIGDTCKLLHHSTPWKNPELDGVEYSVHRSISLKGNQMMCHPEKLLISSKPLFLFHPQVHLPYYFPNLPFPYLFLVSHTPYMVFGTWYPTLGAWSSPLGTWSLTLGAWYFFSQSWYLVSHTWYLVIGFPNLVLGTWSPKLVLGLQHLVYGAWSPTTW